MQSTQSTQCSQYAKHAKSMQKNAIYAVYEYHGTNMQNIHWDFAYISDSELTASVPVGVLLRHH